MERGRETGGDREGEKRRDRRVPGSRPASLPVTRREPRRPARKRPAGISIFPLGRFLSAERYRAKPSRVGWSNATFDSFFRDALRDRARAPERGGNNDRERETLSAVDFQSLSRTESSFTVAKLQRVNYVSFFTYRRINLYSIKRVFQQEERDTVCVA